MGKIDIEVLKEIAFVRKAMIDIQKRLNNYTDGRDDVLDERANDNENATCELSEDIADAIADLENALCELTEE